MAHICKLGNDMLRRIDLATDATGIATFVDGALRAANDAIDILVNNAAFLVPSTPTADTTEAAIDSALNVNVKAPFLVTALIAQGMLARHDGSLVISARSTPPP